MQDYDTVVRRVVEVLDDVFKHDVLGSLSLGEERPRLIVHISSKLKIKNEKLLEGLVDNIKQKTIKSLPKEDRDTFNWDELKVESHLSIPRSKSKMQNPKNPTNPKNPIMHFTIVHSKIRGKVKAVVALGSSEKERFRRFPVKSLTSICRHAGIIIEDARLFRDLGVERDKLRSIVESAAEGIIVADENGEIVLINPRTKEILGLAKGVGRIPRAFSDFIISPLRDELMKTNRAMAFRELDLPGPKKLSVRVAMAPMRDALGKRMGFVCLFQDITKEKEIERMKSELVSTVSHELRTPLATMKEFVSILSDGIAGPVTNDQKEYLTIVMSNMNRLGRMINDLLDVSKLEAGRMELKKRLVDMDLLIKDQVASFKAEAENKKVLLEPRLPAKLPPMYIDPDRVTQVIVNLIGNAIKFTPEGGRVLVAARENEGSVAVSVQDTGVGITKENFSKIFDRFRQIDRKPGPGAKGTGLGLSISKEFVELHKGRLWVESEVGKGSKFTFTLPKIEEEAYFYECIADGIKRARDSGTTFSIIVFELVDKERLEKKFGQDAVLGLTKDLEELLKASVRRASDMVFRFRKSQFVTILCGNGKEDLEPFSRRLKGIIEAKEFKVKEQLIRISARCSLATYPEDAGAGEELVEKAISSLKKNRSGLTLI